MSSVLEALVAIQAELKAPKDQNAGRYRYRNIEDINGAVKPLASKHGCAVVYSDAFTEDGVCVSTCRLVSPDGEISADGCAYIERAPKNMSREQASGAASSYARKYAACGLFAIDSSEADPDRTNAQQSKPQKTKGQATKRRFAQITALKADALSLGIKEEGIREWLAATFPGKEMADFDDAELNRVERHLEQLCRDKRELMGLG